MGRIFSKERMKVHYKAVITEVNEETGEEREVINKQYRSMAMLCGSMDNEDGFSESLLNENILNLAADMASSHVHKTAAKLACLMIETKEEHSDFFEEMLTDSIVEGGLQ